MTPTILVRSGSVLRPTSSAFLEGQVNPLVTIQSHVCPSQNSWQEVSAVHQKWDIHNSYSTILSFSHTASLGWSASPKLCLPHSLVSTAEAALDGLEHCYSRLPGQETMVRVILPRSSFRRRTKAVWVIPHVLFPFTSSKMSPHLHRPRRQSKKRSIDINKTFRSRAVLSDVLNTLSCHRCRPGSPPRWSG